MTGDNIKGQEEDRVVIKRRKWHLLLSFAVGLMVSKGLDSVMHVQDLNNWLSSMEPLSAGTALRRTQAIVVKDAFQTELESLEEQQQKQQQTSQEHDKEEDDNNAQQLQLPQPKDPGLTAIPPQSGFDVIVKTATDRVVHDANQSTEGLTSNNSSSRQRQVFDVDFWESRSGLTTRGGLRREDRILLGRLYGKATSVFEYGLGESTYLANYLGVPRYSGIDSDPTWVSMARDKVASHFRFYLGDIGTTKAWGYPKKDKLPKQILNYQLAPLLVELEPFDVYMVDGRWRMPCALASFLHASARGAPHNQTTVLIHDCPKAPNNSPSSVQNRQEYKQADYLLDMVEHSGAKLCVYKRKANTTDEQLTQAWHENMDVLARR